MLRRLVIWAAVLAVAGLLAIPAFAQTADLSLMWGSDEWIVNMFGDENGDLTEFCTAAAEDQASWSAQFPNLVELCGWTAEEPAA